MENDTITITTPRQKAKIVLKTWITGKDAEYINQPLFDAMTMKTGVKDAGVGDIKMNKVTEVNHRTLESFIVSVNEVTENVLDLVLGLHEDDTQFIQDEITELRKKK